MNNFEWTDATSVDEAVQLTVKGSAFKAGGMDVVDLMKENLFSPTRLINLRTIPGLDQINNDEKNGLSLGPLVTLAQLSESDVVRQRYTALQQCAADAATPQVRNMATVGGNLLQRPRCWYFRNEQFPCRKKGGEICFAQDGENQYHAIFNNRLCAIVHPSAAACALVAMNGRIEIQSGEEKRQVALEDFFVLPSEDLHRENKLRDGEVITNILVPAPAANTRSLYIKQKEKESFDWPIAEVAVVMQLDGDTCQGASIVLGAAAPVPLRASRAQEALANQRITEAVARDAAEAAMADASPLSLNAYKVPLFKVLIARAILASARGEAKGEA